MCKGRLPCNSREVQDKLMKIDDVPQDDNPTFKGYGTKAVYAVDEQGRYTKTTTSGWSVEEVVLRDVLADFDTLAADAKRRALRGEVSPIEFFLYRRLMDLPSLARAGPLAKPSRQPLLPQAHTGPFGSMLTWPNSPAAQLVPR